MGRTSKIEKTGKRAKTKKNKVKKTKLKNPLQENDPLLTYKFGHKMRQKYKGQVSQKSVKLIAQCQLWLIKKFLESNNKFNPSENKTFNALDFNHALQNDDTLKRVLDYPQVLGVRQPADYDRPARRKEKTDE